MRHVYTALFILLLPLILLRLWWRGRAQSAYRKRWRERLGWAAASDRPTIWVHSVSVGETLAAVPMIKALQLKYPDYQIYVTTTTPTGSERVIAAFGDTVSHSYLPYDLPWFMRRFVRQIKPKVAIVMETELWPNMVAACHSQSIPVVIANARLSERSASGYQRFRALTSGMLRQLTLIAAQNTADADRFAQLGVPRHHIQVTGNIKFDLAVESVVHREGADFRNNWRAESRPVWLAASTHDGEDLPLLNAHQLLLKSHPSALLVIVPRHPERFDQVFALAASLGFSVHKHSESKQEVLVDEASVIIGDTMGELLSIIAGSDVVFMGGTLVEVGGHNYIEPAALAKPILSGPSRYNFEDISNQLLDIGALQIAEQPEDIAGSVRQLIVSEAEMKRRGENARLLADQNRGALARLLTSLEEFI